MNPTEAAPMAPEGDQPAAAPEMPVEGQPEAPAADETPAA